MRSKIAEKILKGTPKHIVEMARTWADFKVSKVETVIKIDRQVIVILSNGEAFTLAPFGKDVYTTVSDGIDKSFLDEFKKDALECDFDEIKLRELWKK